MTDFKKLADALWHARNNGPLCPFPNPMMSVTDAYTLQQAACSAAGEDICGYKIGATADETLALLGLSEPFYGAMFSAYTTYTQAEQTLDVALNPAHTSRVEAEFVACLKNDVQRGEKDIELSDLLEHIDWVAPGFEFIGSRYTPPEGSPGTSVIGDFGAHQHSAIGSPERNWRDLDLTSHAVSLQINGESVANGHSGMSIFGHPLQFVCWLLNQPAMAAGLNAGQIISCGTCTGAIAVNTGDLVEADYGPMGALKVRIGTVS